jgi:hypothetical protein
MNDNTDYYDIPTEWIPSSNFANRPTSEISEINLVDGLWTFIYSYGSSSSSSEVEENTNLLNPRHASESAESESGAPSESGTTATSCIMDTPQPRLRSLSNDVKIMERPNLRWKAATAPPGTLSVPNYAPELPRCAVSARSRPPKTFSGRDQQQTSRVTDRLNFRKTRDDDLKGPQGPLPSPPHLEIQDDSSLTLKDARLLGSFSQKARVRKSLNEKKMAKLKMDMDDFVDFESRGLLSSPASMLDTPREMYAIPEHPMAEEPCSPSSPYAKKARESILSSLSGTSPTLHLGKTRLCEPMHDGHIRKSNSAGWQPMYVAGAIRLEEHAAKLRKDSVASLDPFAKEVESEGKRNSDLLVVDSITTFFDDLGVMEYATEECLDMYWHDARRAARHVASAGTSIEEAPVTSVAKPQGSPQDQGSRFSFSSASSSSSQARPGTPMRQRDKLKRLLSPAFPGSGFRRTPVDAGQQGETW